MKDSLYNRISGFFGNKEDGAATDTGDITGAKKSKSAGEIYRSKIEKSNEAMDKKADEATRAAIIELVENNINRKYFKESRLEAFFEKCFTLVEPEKLMKEKVIYNFVYYDLKQLL